MNKAAAGFLRWGVVLGLLVALPAFALREKWSEFAAFFMDHSGAAELASSGGFPGSTLQIGDEKPPAGQPPAEMIKVPGRPDHIQTQGDRHLHDAAPQIDEAPQSARLRDLRTCVYRPLSSGDDQIIQRIPANSPGVQNHVIR